MTIQRFYWQQKMVNEHPGVVLNVGCNEDPARLKQSFGYRLLNCDFEAYDQEMNRPNVVDIIFDGVKDRWPFPDNYASLIILGDMLEHLLVPDIEEILTRAYRVGHKLAITVPKDERIIGQEQINNTDNPYMYHQTVVTEELLKEQLEKTNWQIVDWQTVDYQFVPEGYFVLCKRKTTPQSLGLTGGPSQS
jgi:predicted SAM-dependent methyltransferase